VEALEGATEAMKRGAAEEAQHLLAGCQLKLLPDKLRAHAEALSVRVAEAGTTRMLERRLEEARRTDDSLLARDLVRELADRSSGTEREHCLEEHRRLSETVRKTWHVRVLEGAGPARVIPGWASFPTWEDAAIWLTDDASRVVVCSVLGAWVFVQVLELSSRQVVGGVMLRTPEPLGPMTEHVVEGETLWIFGEGGRLLRVSIRDWEIVGFQLFGELLPKDVTLERVVPFPGASRLWVASRTRDDLEERHHVVDLTGWRLSRSVSVGCLLNPLLGGEEPRMLGTHMNRSGGAIYTATGRLLHELTLRGSLLGGAIHPDGEGLVVLVDALADPDEEDGPSLAVAEVSARGQGGELVALQEGGPEYPNCVVTASDDRLMFALVTAEARKRTLVALRRDASGLRTGYRARVPAETVLVQDRRARKAALVVLGPDGIGLHPLGRRRPRVDSGSGHPDHELPRLTAPFYCEGTGSSAPEAVVLALVTRLEDLTGAEKRHWLAEFRRTNEDDPEKLLALVSALRRTGGELDEAEDLLESVLDRHPRHPATAVEWAHRLSRIEEWDEVRRRLEGVDSGRRQRTWTGRVSWRRAFAW